MHFYGIITYFFKCCKYNLRLVEENLQISENISFREETAAYTGFAKDTVNLMLKYGGEQVNNLLADPESVDMDALISIMSQEDFQNEFDELILSFGNDYRDKLINILSILLYHQHSTINMNCLTCNISC